MQTFNHSIYGIGQRAQGFMIPSEIVKELKIEKGDYLFCYLYPGEGLAFSREQRKKVPIGRYKVIKNHYSYRLQLPKNWIVYNKLQSKDRIDINLKGTNIIITKAED